MYKLVIKRMIDIVASLGVLFLLSPLFVIFALIIFIQDRGPVFFKHPRIGKDGKPFNFIKFRSMPINTPIVESHQTAVLKVTPFGQFIRRTNLDELPQLYCILSGKMSLIGPRPSLTSQHQLIELRKQNGALSIRPGLTGWAQVNAYDFMPESEKAAFDGYYAQHVSLLLDCKIVFRTFVYLTKKPPVY